MTRPARGGDRKVHSCCESANVPRVTTNQKSSNIAGYRRQARREEAFTDSIGSIVELDPNERVVEIRLDNRGGHAGDLQIMRPRWLAPATAKSTRRLSADSAQRLRR